MPRIAKVIIGNIDTLTGGYLYEKKLVEYLRCHGEHAEVVSIPHVPLPLHIVSNIWLAVHLLRKRYDIIIEDEMAHPAVWLFNVWARHIKSLKVVAIVHMLQYLAIRQRWQRWWIRFTEQQMLMSTDLIIANSKHTKFETEKLIHCHVPVKVIYPGFDTNLTRFDREPPGETVKLLFVGNLEPRKGLHVLVKAVQHLGDPRIELDVVGDDSFRPAYARQVRHMAMRRGPGGKFRFHGRVSRDNIGRFFSQADIFVLPSSYEPFGIVFAEAMHFGLPIIATGAGGIPELVEHQVNGLLVPPDDAEALAEAISIVACNHELRMEMGRKSYEKSRSLNTWDECFDQIYRYLDELLMSQVKRDS